ncbi:MAG: dipicolinate synthase [Oscillospiraceae bacterium]|nr:dipicolinate synthase [Oscillospiraceae bacterium]
MIMTVLGGDTRSVYLVSRLVADGHTVHTYGLETAAVPKACHRADLATALRGSDCVVLPIPAVKDGILNTPFGSQAICLTELVNTLPEAVPIFAGAPGKVLSELCTRHGLRLIDLLTIETLTLKNAALTAECALGLVIQEVPYTLMGEPVLILGAGRIGRQLAVRLHALGAKVTISSRNGTDKTWCAAHSLSSADTYGLAPLLPKHRLVINTIPARVLDAGQMAALPSGALLVELASAPGGFDPNAAANLGLQVLPAGGLPGKFAPESAANAIAETIYSYFMR